MSAQEVERISNFLANNDIYLPSNNNWLKSCIDWFRSHDDLSNTYTSVEHYVLIQWLLADLGDVQSSCLPSVSTVGKIVLSGKFNVQINWSRDIAQSCYSQLQNIQTNNCESESNDFVSADEPKKQSWEPNPKRVLMMELTDGVNTVKAMEHSPIPRLVEPFLPGLKVLLKGPIECRNGILFLSNNTVTILGGEVEDLHKSNAKEMILSKCLNIVPNQTANAQESERNSVDHQSRPTDSSLRRNPVSHNNRPPTLQEPPRQNRQVSTAQPERDMFMDDDDEDDIFLQLPEEMFNRPANDLFSVSNESNATNSWRKEENKPIPTFKAPLRLSNKPKLFPFLEERGPNVDPPVNNIETEKIHPSSISSIPEVPEVGGSEFPRERFQPSPNTNTSSSFRNTFLNKATLNESRRIENPSFVEEINEDSSDCVFVEDNPVPKFVMTNVKVQDITLLKIRNKEWTCTAKAIVDGESTDISFSNKVLEKLFNVTASALEVQKEEMKSNEDLKKKVSAILKTGQTKIKTLNCTMSLEYSSEDCIPSVVSVDM